MCAIIGPIFLAASSLNDVLTITEQYGLKMMHMHVDCVCAVHDYNAEGCDAMQRDAIP